MSGRPRVRLGLIGDNIARSRSPDLHRLAGQLCGIDVTYDLFIPKDLGADFETVLGRCRAEGLRGVNVTYPYKERVMAAVAAADPLIRRIGSANTLVFENGVVRGHNTDHSGFLAAYRAAFGAMRPGRVALIGAGGVGRAVAFGLGVLAAEEVRLIDRERDKADALAAALGAAFGTRTAVSVHDDFAAAAGADAVLNGTPVGMVGNPGTPIPAALLSGIAWAFDAVYTPVETRFKADAEAAGARVLSGYELFFHQGLDAFGIFTGRRPADLGALRRMLAAAAPAAI